MKFEMKLTGLEGMLKTLQSLPPEIVSNRGGPVRAALRRGALVILAAEQANLAAVTANATASGKKESTNFLLKHLIVSRGKAPFGRKGERYLVRIKRASYARKGEIVTTLKTGQILEYGSAKQPAEPWIRPAVAARGQEALLTIQRELVESIDRIVKRLAKQNR